MSSVAANTGNGATTYEENDLLPDDVSFTNEDVERDMTRPKLRSNTHYRFKVTGAKNRVFPKGTIYAELTVNPLDAEGKTRGPSTRLKINYPFANPKVAGHTAPNMAWAWERVLTALYPDKYPAPPRRNKDGTWTTADGQIVSKDEAKAIEKQLRTDIRTAAQTYFRNVNDFVDEVFIAAIEDTEYRDVNLKTICSEAPAGVDVRMADFADTSV